MNFIFFKNKSSDNAYIYLSIFGRNSSKIGASRNIPVARKKSFK